MTICGSKSNNKPMAFGFEQNDGNFVRISNGLVLKWSGPNAIAIAIMNHSKTEPLEIQTSKHSVF